METVIVHSNDLVVPILVEWLNVADVARFDTACAFSRSTEANLRRIFALPEVVFHRTKHMSKRFNRYTGGLLPWLLARKMKVANVEITHNVLADSQLVDTYLRMCGPALRFLKFTVYDNEIMSIATESCLHIKKLFIANGAEIEENSTLFSNSIETFVLKSELQEMKNCLCIKFVNMKSLTVGGVHICDRIFAGILQHASKLQQLTLLCGHGLTEVSCAAIGQYCQSLEQLSVSNMRFSAANLKCILPFTPQLKKLSLFRTTPGYSETRSVLDAVTDSCPLLMELAFYEDGSAPCPAICTAFVRLLTHCLHLRTLSMEFCRFVTDDFLIAIAANAKLMSSLNLCGCDVSNAGVAQIAKHCAELQCIRVSAGKNYMQFETTAECKAFFRSETNVRIQDFDNMSSAEFGMGQYSSDEDDESIALSRIFADSAEEEEDEEDCESDDVDDSSEENFGT